MTDYFAVQLPPEQIRSISSIGLAHIGDAVYELLVRTWLCAGGKATGRGLHRAAVALVCAPRQAELAEKTKRLKELNILLNMDEKDKTLMDDGPDEGEEMPERKVVGLER